MQVKVGLREREGLTSMSRFRALRHPLWWVALGVLVTNDWVLKSSGLLPGWVTGKLSDFAGMIVAPVLLSAALGARSAGTRALCFGAIAGVFAAIKLFASAARLVESWMSALGVPWRIWVDPSDLVALAVIPVAWWIASPRRAGVAPISRLERAALVLGSLACVATSWHPDEEPPRASVYLVNVAREPIMLRIHRVVAPLDCGAVATDPEARLAAESFVFERCIELAALTPFPLSQDWSGGWAHGLELRKSAQPDPAQVPACDAVLLRAEGLADTVLFWNGLTSVVVKTESFDWNELDPHAIYLEQAGPRLFAMESELVRAWPADFVVPDEACEGTR
jgi:hypothetical protein